MVLVDRLRPTVAQGREVPMSKRTVPREWPWDDWGGKEEPMAWEMDGPMVIYLERLFGGRFEWWVEYVPVVLPR